MSTLSHDEDDLDEEMDEEVEEVAPEAAEPANDDQITFNGKRVSVDVGLKRCVALIEKGTGSWQHVAGKCACDCHASAARLDSVPRDRCMDDYRTSSRLNLVARYKKNWDTPSGHMTRSRHRPTDTLCQVASKGMPVAVGSSRPSAFLLNHD